MPEDALGMGTNYKIEQTDIFKSMDMCLPNPFVFV